MNQITIYRRLWTETNFRDRENWFVERVSGLTYLTKQEGEKAAEETFHLTNAPTECLNEDHLNIIEKQNFKGPPVCVGDIIKVESVVTKRMAQYFLCKSVGWEKFEGNRIELLKFLS